MNQTICTKRTATKRMSCTKIDVCASETTANSPQRPFPLRTIHHKTIAPAPNSPHFRNFSKSGQNHQSTAPGAYSPLSAHSPYWICLLATHTLVRDPLNGLQIAFSTKRLTFQYGDGMFQYGKRFHCTYSSRQLAPLAKTLNVRHCNILPTINCKQKIKKRKPTL